MGEVALIGIKLIYEAIYKVQITKERLKTSRKQQKLYVDDRQRDIEFDVLHSIYLKISPMKGVIRSFKKGKLSSRYVVCLKYFHDFLIYACSWKTDFLK